MALAVETAFVDGGVAVGGVGNVFITISRHRAEVDTLRRMRTALTSHFKRWPAGVGTISVMESTSYSGQVTHDEREEMAKMSRDYAARAVALVIEGTGFRPAAIRTMLAGLYLVSRPTYPRRIFDTVDHGIGWLVPSASAGIAGAVDDATLRAAIAALRNRLPPFTPGTA